MICCIAHFLCECVRAVVGVNVCERVACACEFH